MKKAKLSLALVAGLVATIGLSSCNEATYKAGVVLTYKDAAGTRVEYQAKDLFADYQETNSASSTNFDKVYELLIRKYYNDDTQKAVKAQIDDKAQNSVNDDMKSAATNASNNGTTYTAELEKILNSHSVETIDQDFEYWQYHHEKELFETNFYKENLSAMKNSGLESEFAAGTKAHDIFGDLDSKVSDKGYIKEQMPYHVRHILRKVSASSGDLTQGKITETEAKQISKVIFELAGAKADGVTKTTRQTFGEIAVELSEDSSASSYGDLGKMDLSETYVNEFKLGLYAFDALYNKTNKDNADKSKLLPSDDEDKVVVDDQGTEKTVKKYFEDKGIGELPYGAAIALANAADVDTSNKDFTINDGNEAFLPRNILFNKYFNKHNICVIVPKDVPYNTADYDQDKIYTSEETGTAVNQTYAALPGFSTDTSSVLGNLDYNALTDDSGHIVLAVRAGSSGSYEGIHFIVVERSALDTTVSKTDSDVTDLSEYWTNEYTDSENYPTYTAADGTKTLKTTYVNFFTQKTATYKERADKVTSWIKGYNSNVQSYIFAYLINKGSITFAENEFGADFQENIKTYVANKLEHTSLHTIEDRNSTWKTYAEYLIHQDYVRKAGEDTGTGKLISETCAIGYLKATKDSNAAKGEGIWAPGGACYGK